MRKLLVSDYDNTFYTDEISIKENVKKVDEFRKNGNLFVIATSRSWQSISKELEKYNIECDYIICNVGGIIIRPKDEKVMYANFLKSDIAAQIEEILKYEEDIEITRFRLDEQKQDLEKILGYKIKGNKASLDKINKKLQNINLNLGINFYKEIYSKSEKIYNESKLFINGNNTKEAAVDELCKIIGENADIITVGDDLVDIGMVKKYNGYRMKNSSEIMKNTTNKIAENVYELLT